VRLPQRRHVLRQDIRAPELRERPLRGLVRRRTPRDQLTPAVVKVLRKLLDNLVLARRR
jgi:hypothetical protein